MLNEKWKKKRVKVYPKKFEKYSDAIGWLLENMDSTTDEDEPVTFLFNTSFISLFSS